MSNFISTLVRWISHIVFFLLIAFRFSSYAEGMPDWKSASVVQPGSEIGKSGQYLSAQTGNPFFFQSPDLISENFSSDESSETDEEQQDTPPELSGNANSTHLHLSRKWETGLLISQNLSTIWVESHSCPLFLQYRNLRL